MEKQRLEFCVEGTHGRACDVVWSVEIALDAREPEAWAAAAVENDGGISVDLREDCAGVLHMPLRTPHRRSELWPLFPARAVDV
jgi:hypothetical protein